MSEEKQPKWSEKFDEKFKDAFKWIRFDTAHDIISGVDMLHFDKEIKQFISSLMDNQKKELPFREFDISAWKNYGEERDYFKFFEDKIKKELIEKVKGMMGGKFQLTGGGQKKKGIALGWNSHRELVIKKLNKLK